MPCAYSIIDYYRVIIKYYMYDETRVSIFFKYINLKLKQSYVSEIQVWFNYNLNQYYF